MARSLVRFLPAFAVIAALALSAAWGQAPASGVAAADIQIPHKTFVLDNGLTLIVHEDPKTPIVAVNVWYHVGSKNEKPGRTGFAHLFEHLMFNGSENFNTDYFKAVEPIGATDLNGTTNNDRTNYFQNVPKSALDTVLWLESDRMGHLIGAIDQAKLDEQRGVVQNEKRQYENQPYALADELMTKACFPAGHPYSWTVIGSMEDLSAAKLEDVHEWFKTYYGAANAVLSIAGDVKADEVLAKVKTYFGDIPPGPPVSHHDAWIAKRAGTQRQKAEDRVPAARIYKVWNVPRAGSADNDYLGLAASALTSGKTSRLYKRLVYDDQIATSVQAYVDEREIASLFMVEATAKPGGDLAAVEKALDEEFAKFLAQGPTEAEVERVKAETVSGFIRGVERIGGFGGKSDILAASQVYLGSPDAWRISFERYKNAKAADIKGAATRWLSDGVYILEVHPFPPYKEAAQGADRSKMPEPGTPPAAAFPKVERATLSNGLEVVLAERRAVPVVNLDLLIDAGYAADQGGLPGTASLAMNMLDEGTKKRSSLEISDELQRLGATLNTGSDLDTSTVSMSALRANLDASLDLLADVVLQPAFPQADFDRLKAQQLARIKQEKAQPIAMALRVFPRVLFGKDHAYGIPFTGSGFEDTVAKLTRDDLVKFHAGWFKPNHATLVVVGDATMAEMKPKLEALFKDWKRGDTPKKNLAQVAPPKGSTIYLVDRPGSIQSIVMAGQLAPPTANQDEIAIQTMHQILAGAFIARLNMNLREDKHWSYGARGFMPDAKGQRPYIFFAPVQSDKTKESMAEMAKEIRGMQGEKPATAEELSVAKDSQTLTLAGEWETAAAVAERIGRLETFGLPADWYSTFASKVRAVQAGDVATAGKKLLHPDALVWVVVGDRAAVEPRIKDLGFGEIQLMDADGNLVK